MRVVLVVLLMLSLGRPGFGQGLRPEVIVEDFQTAEGDVLSAFVGTFVALRLQELSGVTVVRQPQSSCDRSRAVESGNALQQVISPAAQSLGIAARVRYAVGGGVRITRRSETGGPVEYIVDYRVADVGEDCSEVPFRTASHAFTPATALAVVSEIGDEIAAEIEQRGARRTAVELAIDADAEIRTLLVRALTLRLSDEPELMLRAATTGGPSSAFRIEGSVSTGPDLGATLTVVSPDGRRVQLATIQPTTGDDTRFYLAAADAAVRGLNQVRYSLQAGGGGQASEVSTPTLQRRAEELMCRTSTQRCTPNYKAALGILETVSNLDLGQWLLMGEAALGAGEPAKAADAFDRGLAAVGAEPPSTQADWAQRAADAWYAAGDQTRAVQRYSQAIAILERENQIVPAALYVNQANAHTIAGQHAEALDVLLQGAARARAAEQQAVVSAVRQHVEVARGDRLLTAYERLRGSNRAELNGVASAISARVVTDALDLARRSLAERRFADTDRELGIVESMPPGAVDAVTRRSVLRMRAAWHRDSRADWATAIALLDDALAIGPDPAVRYDKALTHYFRAQRAGNQPRPDLEQAVALASDLARERYYVADTLVFDINRRLRRDADTRALFQPIVAASSSADVPSEARRSAIRILALVCGEYQFDFACAQQAWRALMPVDFEAEPSLHLDVLESDIISRVDSLDRLAALSTLTSLSPEQRKIALFYETWAFAAAGRDAQAQDAYDRWTAHTIVIPETVWLFNGARQALPKDPRPSPAWRQRLQAMLQQMATSTPAR